MMLVEIIVAMFNGLNHHYKYLITKNGPFSRGFVKFLELVSGQIKNLRKLAISSGS